MFWTNNFPRTLFPHKRVFARIKYYINDKFCPLQYSLKLVEKKTNYSCSQEKQRSMMVANDRLYKNKNMFLSNGIFRVRLHLRQYYGLGTWQTVH